MSDPNIPEPQADAEPEESFAEALSQFEKSRAPKSEEAARSREATVIAITADSVLFDIGFKSEGAMPLTAFEKDREQPKPGDKMLVRLSTKRRPLSVPSRLPSKAG